MLGLALSIYNESKRKGEGSSFCAHPPSEGQKFLYWANKIGPRKAPEKPAAQA